MKKESSTNSQKYSGQKNLDASSSEISEISLAQLILEQFAVNKETYKILLDIMYGDEGDQELENLKTILMAHGQMQCYMREKVTNTCAK